MARNPIDRPGSPGWRRFVDDCRAELDRDGLFNLPGFGAYFARRSEG